MSKKNNLFFKKLESFKKKAALILENNKVVTYSELLLGANKISKIIEPEKKLIFLLHPYPIKKKLKIFQSNITLMILH